MCRPRSAQHVEQLPPSHLRRFRLVPRAAAYGIASYLHAVEQLTITTLRNVLGSMDLERTLTSRDTVNSQLRGVLDEATGKWGLRVNRVESTGTSLPVIVRTSTVP